LFPEHFLEQPHSLDVSERGAIAVLDQGGRRLSVARPKGKPEVHEIGFRAIRCRFLGEHVVLLGEDGLVVTLRADGTPVGETRVREGAVNLAVTRAGGVLVSYGRRGSQDHGVTMERLGAAPVQYADTSILDANCIAVESGALWLGGTGSESPPARVVRLRPSPAGFSAKGTMSLPAPPRAAAVGPDGALWVLLEPGESVVRIFKDRPEPAQRLREPAAELARDRRRLLSCGPRGLCDVTFLVPRPEGSLSEPDLPSCAQH
jgi:hypothetical protein